jgi:hypothetical protein
MLNGRGKRGKFYHEGREAERRRKKRFSRKVRKDAKEERLKRRDATRF